MIFLTFSTGLPHYRTGSQKGGSIETFSPIDRLYQSWHLRNLPYHRWDPGGALSESAAGQKRRFIFPGIQHPHKGHVWEGHRAFGRSADFVSKFRSRQKGRFARRHRLPQQLGQSACRPPPGYGRFGKNRCICIRTCHQCADRRKSSKTVVLNTRPVDYMCCPRTLSTSPSIVQQMCNNCDYIQMRIYSYKKKLHIIVFI